MIKLTRNDIGVILSFTVKSPAGVPIDLSGATVTLELFNACGNSVLNVSCLAVNLSQGQVQYTTVGTDLDLPAGTYVGAIKAEYSVSKILTSSQFEIKIHEPSKIE